MAAIHSPIVALHPLRGSSSRTSVRQNARDTCSCTRSSANRRQVSQPRHSSSNLRIRILDGRGTPVRFHMPVVRFHLPAVRAVVDTNETLPGGTSQGTGDDLPPPGCNRIKVELRRPLGLVLEEKKDGGIFVSGIVPGGNAEKAGGVEVGDELIATSAVVYNSEMDYGGVKVRKGEEVVRLAVRGEKFNTVMAAISTHPAVMKVKLELQKCPK